MLKFKIAQERPRERPTAKERRMVAAMPQFLHDLPAPPRAALSGNDYIVLVLCRDFMGFPDSTA